MDNDLVGVTPDPPLRPKPEDEAAYEFLFPGFRPPKSDELKLFTVLGSAIATRRISLRPTSPIVQALENTCELSAENNEIGEYFENYSNRVDRNRPEIKITKTKRTWMAEMELVPI